MVDSLGAGQAVFVDSQAFMCLCDSLAARQPSFYEISSTVVPCQSTDYAWHSFPAVEQHRNGFHERQSSNLPLIACPPMLSEYLLAG